MVLLGGLGLSRNSAHVSAPALWLSSLHECGLRYRIAQYSSDFGEDSCKEYSWLFAYDSGCSESRIRLPSGIPDFLSPRSLREVWKISTSFLQVVLYSPPVVLCFTSILYLFCQLRRASFFLSTSLSSPDLPSSSPQM